MTKVIADITMSIDGFVTGPDPDLEHGLGHGGEPLHVWAFSDDEVDAAGARGLDRAFRRRRHGPSPLRHHRRPAAAGTTRWGTAPRRSEPRRSSS